MAENTAGATSLGRTLARPEATLAAWDATTSTWLEITKWCPEASCLAGSTKGGLRPSICSAGGQGTANHVSDPETDSSPRLILAAFLQKEAPGPLGRGTDT